MMRPKKERRRKSIPVERSIIRHIDSSDRRRSLMAHEYANWQIRAPTYDSGEFKCHPLRLEDIHDFVRPELNIPKGATVVDLATGTGQVPQHILSRYRPKRVIGVDWASRMLDIAKGEGRIDHAVLADVSHVPIKENTADFVTAIDGHAWRSVIDPDSAFRDVRHILRPGAQALIAIPIEPRMLTVDDLRRSMDHSYPTREIRDSGLEVVKRDIIETRTGHELVVLARKKR